MNHTPLPLHNPFFLKKNKRRPNPVSEYDLRTSRSEIMDSDLAYQVIRLVLFEYVLPRARELRRAIRLVELTKNVSFTPLCRCTPEAFSEVVLYASDALLRPYGYASSFVCARTAPYAASVKSVYLNAIILPGETGRERYRMGRSDPWSGDRV